MTEQLVYECVIIGFAGIGMVITSVAAGFGMGCAIGWLVEGVLQN